jgi:hypothetical protein
LDLCPPSHTLPPSGERGDGTADTARSVDQRCARRPVRILIYFRLTSLVWTSAHRPPRSPLGGERGDGTADMARPVDRRCVRGPIRVLINPRLASFDWTSVHHPTPSPLGARGGWDWTRIRSKLVSLKAQGTSRLLRVSGHISGLVRTGCPDNGLPKCITQRSLFRFFSQIAKMHAPH